LLSHRNWKTFDERSFDFCQGITLHHLPGHTDGLIGMQINLPDSGTIFFISDHCHVIENVSPTSLHCSHDFKTLSVLDKMSDIIL
jgi:glyoxylase-like metal-dependent hydrolase (beta-lactamase superfamily II)